MIRKLGINQFEYDVEFKGDVRFPEITSTSTSLDTIVIDSTGKLFKSTGSEPDGIGFDGSGDLIIQQPTSDKDIIFIAPGTSDLGDTVTYITIDSSVATILFSQEARFTDNVNLKFGTGGDTMIYHDGSNSYIDHTGTGHLYIRQGSDDNDIIFQSDDQSGGLTTYLTLDGSNGYIRLEDDRRLTIGSGNDLQLRHTSSGTFITNFTHDFNIVQQAADKDITFQCDDGSGGVETYFFLDGSASSGNPITQFPDLSQLVFGNSQDLLLRHDGTDSLIQNNGGDFIISQHTNDKDLIFKCDDGSGSTTEYFRLDGGSEKTFYSKPILLFDSVALQLGTGTDATLYHSGGEGTLQNFTGNFRIIQSADNSDIQFFCDDGSGGTTEYLRIDGGQEVNIFSKNIKLEDNVMGMFGGGNDLKLRHNGTDSFIENETGDLTIKNSADDKDIIFQSDDGSGGTTTYFYLDGDTVHNRFPKSILLDDNVNLDFGGSGNTRIKTDGTDTFIQNYVGDFYIQQATDDKDIIFQSDDGSGGSETYFRLDGSTGYVQFADNRRITIGSSDDANIRHDGTDTYIGNSTGHFYIQQATDDKDLVFQCDDGSGGLATYFTLDGSLASGSQYFTKWADNSIVALGSAPDLFIFHDGSNSYIRQFTAHDLIIENISDDKDVIFRCDDGSGGVTAYLTLDGSETNIKVEKNLYATDGVLLSVGSGLDLRLKHDGTDSFIFNETGHLYIQNKADDKDIIFQSDDQSGGVTTYFFLDGSNSSGNPVTIFPDNSKLTIGTSSHGISLLHDGSNSTITNAIGNLTITNFQDDGDIIFKSDNGSGGTTTYLTLDGGFSVPYVALEDSTILALGTHKDLLLTHDGTDSKIDNMNTGDIKIRQFADDKDIVFYSDNGAGGTAEYFKLDGSLAAHDGSSYTALYTAFPDNSLAAFGDSQDLVMYHSGSNSFIRHLGTGHLYIDNTTDDANIYFRSDDGSGGLATYFRLNGSAAETVVSKNMRWEDSVEARFGDGSDLQIDHDGSNSYIKNETGNLNLQNNADDADIAFYCDDQSGSVAEYFRLDGSLGINRFFKDSRHNDSITASFGSSDDLKIQHNGTDSYIQNFTGNLNIIQHLDDGRINFQCDDGSGGVTTYFFLDGSLANGTDQLATVFPDTSKIFFGTGQDMQIYHSGTHSFIRQTGVGNLYIDQTQDDADLIFRCDDGSGGLATYFMLDGSSKRIDIPDDIRLTLGTSDDLQIYHNATNSVIENYTGDFFIKNNTDDGDIKFQSDDGSGGTTEYLRIDGGTETVEVAKPINLASASSSTSSGIYAQFINIKGFCTLAANYKYAEDQEDTLAPYEMAEDYGSATISSSTEVNQSKMFRSSGFHVPVACSVNAINMQVTCNNTGNVTIAVVEYRPSELAADQVDHPRTVYEEVVVASNDNNNKVKTVTVATADLDNTAVPAGSHIMIMAKGDSDSIGGKAFISAAIEIKW